MSGDGHKNYKQLCQVGRKWGPLFCVADSPVRKTAPIMMKKRAVDVHCQGFVLVAKKRRRCKYVVAGQYIVLQGVNYIYKKMACMHAVQYSAVQRATKPRSGPGRVRLHNAATLAPHPPPFPTKTPSVSAPLPHLVILTL